MGLARLLACGSATVTLLAASAAAADSHEVANPACKAAHHLVGEWEVHTGDGTLMAEVVWELGPEGCYLVEEWMTRMDGIRDFFCLLVYSDTQDNWSYLAGSGKPGGQRMRFENGNMVENEFRFETADLDEETIGRFSFFTLPDGRLRELSVLSTDGGETWETEYELFWTRKE
ncbi:MAG: hypothetical protein OXG83_01680 [Acidobacteria bacterium]|nr:hypothetical protein [Acidobacteriota bacterium]